MIRRKHVLICAIALIICGIYSVSRTWKSDKNSKYEVSERKKKSRALRTFKRDMEAFSQLKYMKSIADFEREKFNFTILPWNYSKSNSFLDINSKYSMIILVKSHANNIRRRNFIGNTWGKKKFINKLQFEIVYVVGVSNAKDNIALQKENENHGDLLQVSLVESYENLVYKTLAGMQWASETFPEHWFYASMDDDVLPDLIKISNDLQDIIQQEKIDKGNFSNRKIVADSAKSMISTSHEKSYDELLTDFDLPIYCGFGYRTKPKPKRLPDSKWFISEKKYFLKQYPAYCFGGFYSMPLKLMHNLYSLSRSLPIFWIDDIWITGFLRLKYFSNKVSSCPSCKIINTTLGLWTKYSEDYTSVTTGDEKSLANEWIRLKKELAQYDS